MWDTAIAGLLVQASAEHGPYGSDAFKNTPAPPTIVFSDEEI